MSKAVLVRLNSTTPMGQQLYESELLIALRGVADERWEFRDCEVVPMRSTRESGRRLPLRVAWSMPYQLAAGLGRFAYGRVDLVHRLDLRCPPGRLRDEILTVHDLAPLRYDDEGTIPRWAGRSARAARVVLCPSTFAAAEVRELLGVVRTEVVPNGVASGLADVTPFSDAELATFGLRRPLVLHAGGATRRKNLQLLASAWTRVACAQPDAMLALCGPSQRRRDELFARVPRTRRLGFLGANHLPRLMRSASVVVIPSLYEGFGLPALEGMAAGVPVVAVARGALPEVCGDAAQLVPPDASAFADAISRALAGGDDVKRLTEAGRARAASFSWERTARETLAVYERVLGV